MVLTAVHVVVVTPEALLEAGVQGELREEVSGEAEEEAGNSKKAHIGEGSQRVLLFFGFDSLLVYFESVFQVNAKDNP